MPRKVLRFIIVLLGCQALVSLGGCRVLWMPRRGNQPLPPELIQSETTLGTLAATVNANTDRVRQLDANVKISLDGLPAAISGTLLMELPDRMRLRAGLMGINDLGVDIGSNSERFWLWTKAVAPGQQQQILYAPHDGFSQSVVGLQLGIQPRWIVDALGLIRFLETDRHEGPFPRDDQRLTIRSHLKSVSDRYVRDVVVHPKYGWIEQVAIYSSQGKLLAYANAMDHRYYKEEQTVLPRYIELHVFPATGEKMKLAINLKTITLNQLYVPEDTFQMPQPAGVELIDMTRHVPVEPHPRQAAGQVSPSVPSITPPASRILTRDHSPYSRFH